MTILKFADEPVEKPPRERDSSEWGFEEGEDIVSGRYAVKLLGGGRRYEAYLAHDETLLSLVVVKILRPNRADDPEALSGLASEYAMLQRLNHPSIARGFGAVLDGARPHIVLEFLDGPRLSSLIRRHGRLPLEQSIPLAVQLSSALHYMHTQDIVHLDVKPSNTIMAAPPRLIDMSIARSFDEARHLRVPVGTDAYMAPEQCSPGSKAPVGAAADVWGLGATLYHAVSGRLPFPEPEGDERFPQIDLDAQRLDDEQIPPRVSDLVHACLQRDPGDRPTAREISDRLEPLIAALPRRPVLSRLRPRLK